MKDMRFEMREKMTPAEELLWNRLRKRSIHNLRFRRQHGIGPYVADFYHAKSMTVIEVDGSVHEEEEVIKNDKMRERYLIERGYKVIRVTNEEIFKDLEKVLDLISSSINSHEPFPLLRG
jgi:very-short-patch-repair endonuclease